MPVKGVLLDLAGVLYSGREPLPGAVEALRRLRDAGLQVRFVTNTSRQSCRAIFEHLSTLGFSVERREILSAPLAARRYIEVLGRRPYLLIHSDLAEDFAGLATEDPNAVLIADAGSGFVYDRLNAAFRLLMEGAPLIAVAKNRYFREDGALSLDAGPFVVALEFACDIRAELIGKPAREFFLAPVRDMGLQPQECVMIGDDVEADVQGAWHADVHAILVKTGKYREGDESQLPRGGAWLKRDIRDAAGFILDQLR